MKETIGVVEVIVEVEQEMKENEDVCFFIFWFFNHKGVNIYV